MAVAIIVIVPHSFSFAWSLWFVFWLARLVEYFWKEVLIHLELFDLVVRHLATLLSADILLVKPQ